MKNKQTIKVGFLISYDYKYLKESLPRVYPYADYIAFAIDKDRKTWSGESFELPDTFFEWVNEFDTEKKIHMYEDSFYVSTLTTMECESRERNLLAKFMGNGGWHIQIDSDEYFLDFEKFIHYIKSLDITKDTQVYARWITMYKQNMNDYFLIRTNEAFPLVTNNPNYKLARLSDSKNNIYTNFKVLHQSWARSDEEIKQKLSNWGHKTDFDVDSYYNFWKAINKQTYKYARSFHPLDAWLWPNLEYFKAKNIGELTNQVKSFLSEKESKEKQSNKIKAKDFIPPVLYKIKTLLSK